MMVFSNRSGIDESEGYRYAFLYIPIILSSVLLQKLALPQTENMLSAGTLVPPMIVCFGLTAGQLVFDTSAILTLAFFFATIGIDIIFGSAVKITSLSSICLLILAQVPLATRPRDQTYDCTSALRFFSAFMLFLSLLGVAQYLSQWILPKWASFPIDYLLPEQARLVGYNNLNPLAYGADRIKSNGVFFAEPSFFSQAVALAAIIELQFEQRLGRLLIFAAGLMVGYSGTGLLVFAVAGLWKTIRDKRYKLIAVAMIAVSVVLIFAQFFQIDTMTRRINEFGTADTSGNARFVSIFHLISRFQTDDASLLFFGVGAGQINSFIKLLPFDGFGPTWGKVFFEFGVCGFISYMAFLAALFRGRVSAVTISLLIIYLFGGGYLSDQAILAPLLLFVSWAPTIKDRGALNDKNQLQERWLQPLGSRRAFAGPWH